MNSSVLLVLTALGFVSGQWDANSNNGQVIVHLFEWKWQDVANECEHFLGPKGFAGVQVSPPNENVVAYNTDVQRPWWERYQPVSYILQTRSGNDMEFRSMVNRCNNVGVRVYADAVINHMTGPWPAGTVGTAESPFDYHGQSYSGVPYRYNDFHESCLIHNYNDPFEVRNCQLVGLLDLDQRKSYVRSKIIDYMNYLIDIGVAGFRIDAAKHMWPEDLEAIYEGLNNLNTAYFPTGSRSFMMQEVIDLGGEAVSATEYRYMGRVTEFKYSKSIGEAFHGKNQLKWLVNFGEAWGFVDCALALVFIDNHDNQRGHGAGGSDIITFKEPKLYKMANGFMLAWPYGYTRVMSSFDWDKDWTGPPHDENYNTLSPKFNSDGTCNNGWICEHRWRQIYNMVEFRNIVHGTNMNNWWDNGNNQIAFCRGNKGFVAINNEGADIKETLQTCLSAGTYCDVISGSKSGDSCTGKTIDVGVDGTAYIEILVTEEDGILAIHENSKL